MFALEPQFEPVGLLVGTDANGDDFVAGSGVLIDPHWVLTAGHVPQDDPDLPWVSMRFFTNADVFGNLDEVVEADFFTWFPGYRSDFNAGTGNDIGLVRLAEPIRDIEPVTIYRGDAELFGIEFEAAGYGNPGVGFLAGDFDGIRRAGRNLADEDVAVVESQFLQSDFDDPPFDNPLDLEWQASMNDSGGGYFADLEGNTQLIGIHSCTRGLSASSCGIQVNLYLDFIDETIAANPSIPEPSSITLGIASMCLSSIASRWRDR